MTNEYKAAHTLRKNCFILLVYIISNKSKYINIEKTGTATTPIADAICSLNIKEINAVVAILNPKKANGYHHAGINQNPSTKKTNFATPPSAQVKVIVAAELGAIISP
jgi:hypothetical protein